MKFKEDEWLTDYINALHFTVRLIERRGRDRDAAEVLEAETAALIQEAVLGNIPLSVFSIQRIVGRVKRFRERCREAGAGPSGVFPGDLAADYAFLREGLAEFTAAEMVAECRGYLPRIYSDLGDLETVVAALIRDDLDAGVIVESSPGVYRPAAGG